MNEAPKVARTALIDGDIIAFQAAAAAQTQQLDELELQERIIATVKDWTDRAFCIETIVTMSGPRESNFRKEVFPLYKANRPDERPEFLPMAQRIIDDNFNTFKREILEADDCMGILTTLRGADGEQVIMNPVIVSPDKDMRTIPGWQFNPRIEDKRGEDFPVYISQQAADKAFIIQWMIGDTSDGYKGIDRFGEKGAEKLLNETSPTEWIKVVLRKYMSHKKSYTYEYCLQMARCARILTTDNWDSKAKKPVLWEPDVLVSEEWDDINEWINAPAVTV